MREGRRYAFDALIGQNEAIAVNEQGGNAAQGRFRGTFAELDVEGVGDNSPHFGVVDQWFGKEALAELADVNGEEIAVADVHTHFTEDGQDAVPGVVHGRGGIDVQEGEMGILDIKMAVGDFASKDQASDGNGKKREADDNTHSNARPAVAAAGDIGRKFLFVSKRHGLL